jgi:hypothetical protein
VPLFYRINISNHFNMAQIKGYDYGSAGLAASPVVPQGNHQPFHHQKAPQK